MLQNILLVFLGGGVGSVSRFLMMNFISRTTGPTAFPWYTFGVNMIGAFIIGILLEIFALRMNVPNPAKVLLVTGFVGGFTTFSAFSLDSALLLEKGDYVTLGAYIAASVIGTIAAVFIGSGFVKTVM